MRTRWKWLLELLAFGLSCVIAIPLFLVLINSFKTTAEAADLRLSFPVIWNVFENYKQVFIEGKIPQAFWNSSILTVFGVFFVLLFCSASAYIIQRRDSSFTRLLKNVLISGMILPSTLITTYLLLNYLHLVHTYSGVVLLYIAGNYSFVTYLYIAFLQTVPRELDEAAIIDGIGPYSLFAKIIFPLLQPINATAFIVVFMSIWNDFLTPFFYLNTATRFTLNLTTYFFYATHSASWNLVFADLVIISVPVIIMYLFMQRYIVSGLTSGAVKS